ncbi:MAG: bifunctional alpha/beta hydrolase/OsmC family protein [Azospirillaceae bacterium]
MPTERFSFTGGRGDTLSARLDLPSRPAKAYALFAHCFTCGKDIKAASRIAEALTSHGYAVLRFDFTGLGASEGEFANTNFSSNVEDLVAAAAHLKAHHRAPALLIGHSLGGAAVLAAAGDLPEVKAVATIGAPSDPAHVARLMAPARTEIEARGEAEVTIAGRTFRIREQFLEDIERQRLGERIARLRRPLIIFHAPLDEVVGIDNATGIFTAARHPKSFVSLDRADHLLSDPVDASFVAAVLAGWADRYAEPSAQFTAPDPVAEGVVVEETKSGEFQQWVVAGRHQLIADEPLAMGGLDSGPTPYDLLTAALGTCTSMTIRMYARRKGMALDQVRVVVTHDRIHAEDCAECETAEGMIDVFERTIRFDGDLKQEEIDRLLQIADKCPVHRTLMSENVVRTRLVPH